MSGVKSVAVVGSGYWGKNLVRNFSNIGVLRAVCDKSESTLERFREQYPGIQTCLAYSDVLGDSEIESVVIATPAETHYRLAKEALLAGKHVYVEKPLVLDEEEAVSLISLARQAGRVLMVGHLLQYHPVFIRLKEMTLSGELGRINYIYSNRLNLGKIRREENALWSFAPHDISMILSLAGEEPSSVLATGGNYLHREVADVTTTHLEFSSGIKAHIFVSWLHPFKEQKLIVVGDKKMAVFDDTKPWGEKLSLYPHSINWSNNTPVPDRADAEYVKVAESEPLRAECEHFLECIREGKMPQTDGDEGLRVLRVLNAAQKSMDYNSERVCCAPRVKGNAHGDVKLHATAVVDDGVIIGNGTSVWHFSHLMRGSVLGENCRVGQNVVIGPDVRIGDGCKIQNNVSVYTGVVLKDNVFCGPSMVFTNVYNPRSSIPRMSEVRETLVESGATLGANCTIVCGNTIGKFAFVGAGAVVTKDVPAHALFVGNPAKLKGWMCECGVKLDEAYACPGCGAVYDFDEDGAHIAGRRNDAV